jgi:hypothetical protein
MYSVTLILQEFIKIINIQLFYVMDTCHIQKWSKYVTIKMPPTSNYI